MKLNIKNPNTDLIMYEKKSNSASIVVAVIAILLILGGVYFLNKSFTKPKEVSKATISTSSSSSSTKAETLSSSSSFSTSSSSSISSSTSSSSSSNLNSSSSSSTSGLQENEAIIKITKVTVGNESTRYEVEFLDTGLKNGTKLKAGNKIYLNLIGATMSVDKTYKISSIIETDNTIKVSNLKSKEVTP